MVGWEDDFRMIATLNFTNEVKLYLYITNRMVPHFALDRQSLPQGSELDLPKGWWTVWRCEVLITDPDGENNVMVFTNSATLVSFICEALADDFAGMLKNFEVRFVDFMRAKGVHPPAGLSMTVLPMLGEPEELSDDVWWPIDCLRKNLIERKMDTLDAELKVNMGPASEMGGDSPIDYFTEEYARNPLWMKV